MMVATAFPTAAPQAAKGPAVDTASPVGEADSGFASALLQLLGLPASSETAPAASPLVQAVLQTLDEDTKGDTPAPVALPLIPLDAMAARLLPAQGESVAGLAANLIDIGAAGAGPLAGLTAEDLSRALEALLHKGTSEVGEVTEPTSQLLQPAALTQQTQESQGLQRQTGTEAMLPRHLQSSVGTPAWSDELGVRLQLMAEKGQHAASLKLSPEHLGPLEVQISVQDKEATVWFGAQHADTRAALEQALPRLRELFAAQGLSLAQSGVSHESPRDSGQPAPGRGTADLSGQSTEAEAAPLATVTRRGLVDTWA